MSDKQVMENHVKERGEKSGKTFLKGAMIGTVLGAATALLLAPKSGRELRKDISDQYHNVSEKTKDIAGNVTRRTQDIARNISAKAADLAEKAKGAVDSVTGEVKSWKEARSEAAAALEEEVNAEAHSGSDGDPRQNADNKQG